MRYGVGLAVAVALLVALPVGAARRDASAAAQAAAALEVRATANIFGAGRSAPPAGPGGVGTLPPVYLLPKGTDRLLTFSSVTGTITCCKTGSNLYNGPGGRSDYGTNLTGVPGISGVKSRRSMFLAGVFLGAARERESPPTKTHTLTPELGQVFYVGNGQGGDGPLRFEVPDGATRLFLGIADGYNFVGKPSYYGDNAGSFTATFEFPREPEATVLWGVDAHEKKGLVSSAHLTGRGMMVTTEFKEGGFVDTARLLPAQTISGETPHAEYAYEGLRSRDVDMEITSGFLIVQGGAGSETERRSVRLIVEVVRSNKPGCPARSKTRRGARGKLVLIYYPRGAPNSFANADLDLPCGVDEKWTDSDVTIRIEKLKKKR